MTVIKQIGKVVVKWLGVALASVILLLVVVFVVFDWNWVKDPLARKLSELSGRSLTIEGDLDVDVFWPPKLRAERIRFENASWSQDPYMVEVAELVLSVAVGELLTGRIVLPELILTEPNILLETSPQGEPNWQFTADPVSEAVIETSLPEQRTEFPIVKHLLIEDGHLRYRDLPGETDITATFATIQGQGGGGEDLAVEGNGRLQGQPLQFYLNAASLAQLQEGEKPYPVTLEVKAGATSLRMAGTLRQPLQLRGLNLAVAIQGKDLALLSPIVKTSLPKLPPYQFQGQLSWQGNTWKLENFQGSLGNSDWQGNVTAQTGGKRPSLRVNLRSNTLDVEQLTHIAESVGSQSATETASLVDQPLPLELLQSLNAELDIQAAKLVAPAVTLQNAALHLALAAGRLRVEPLQFALGGGSMRAAVLLDTGERSIQGFIRTNLQSIDLADVLSDSGEDSQELGTLSGQLQVLLPAQAEAGPLTVASLIERLRIADSQLNYRDPDAGTRVTVTIATVATDEGAPGLHIEGKGQYQNRPMQFTVTGDPLLELIKINEPYALAGKLTFRVAQVQLPAYQFSVQISQQEGNWKLQNFQSQLGDNDVKGDITLTTKGKRPSLSAELVSERLDLGQLMQGLADTTDESPQSYLPGRDWAGVTLAMAGESSFSMAALVSSQQPEVGQRTAGTTDTPDNPLGTQKSTVTEPFNLEALQALDTQVNWRVKELLITPDLVLHDLSLPLDINNGRLSIEPLRARIGKGSLRADIQLDTRTRPFQGALQGHLQAVSLGTLLQPLQLTEQPLGRLSGDLDLKITGASAAHPKTDVALPFLGRLIIEDSRFSYTDAASDTALTIAITTAGLASGSQVVHINGAGRYQGEPFSLDFSGDPLLDLREPEEPYALELAIDVAQTNAWVKGRLIQPLKLRGLDLSLTLQGPNPYRLYPFIGIPLPSLPPYRIKGQLSRQGDTVKLVNFDGRVGDSDLAGDIELELGGARPMMEAALTSNKIDFDDLAGLLGVAPDTGSGETASAAQQREARAEAKDASVLPDNPLNLERLRAMDAAIRFYGKRIEAPQLPLDDLTIQLALNAGRMIFKPIDFGVGGGSVRARLEIDANERPVTGDFETEVKQVNLGEVLKPFEVADASAGLIGGRAKFWVQGDSVADIFASADGGLFLLMTGGRLDPLLVELAGLDIAESILVALVGDEEAAVPIDCAYADLHAKKGLLDVNTLLVDTTDTLFTADGFINFVQERLHIVITPKPKDASLFSAPVPLHIEGRLQNPDIYPEPEPLFGQGALATVLGALAAPLQGLLPLLQPESDKESIYCTGLVEAINAAR